MAKLITKKIANTVLILLGVSMLSFLLVAFSGKDVAEVVARRNSLSATDEMIEEMRTELGLDKSLPLQYADWMKGFVTGNLGISIQTYKSVSKDMIDLFPKTFQLVGISLIWIVLITLPLALLCGLHKDSIFDQVIRVISILGICIPTFWLGFLFLILFAVRLPIFSVVPKPGIKSLILPSLALAIPVAFSLLRQLRSTILTELSKDYVFYAKARGFSSERIVCRHVLKNALPPIVTLLCQYLGYLIAGSVVVEGVFSLDGIGNYLVNGINNGDARAVASCITVIAGVFVISNLLGELINRLICPWMVRKANEND